ncbi:hypothetical protein FH972_022036 [Carpinus fangiana]|uniref:Phospholipase/carboxylesterase/thioesterase domain-containing protein n=1 Tax=Carpinus fangiana TaxID=176857 RepID=A0A5N6KRF3_9ROSI|nr:hypothetical protein FH972_022036 [Carpinus fangiana]
MLGAPLIAALATVALAAPVIPRQASCVSGVHIIVARGSNEDPGEGAPGVVATLIKNAIPGSDSVAVDYPASIISTSDPLYPKSVSDGITDTINKIHDYVDTCGASSRIVLIGYSQGGNVMTDVLAGGVFKPDPIDPSYGQYITGVVVFGDPSFTYPESFDLGTSTSDGLFSRNEDGDSEALLNTYSNVIESYCDDGDPFCASGDDEDVHHHYFDKYSQQAADFIVSIN